MSEPRFISAISWCEVPKEPIGRYSRITFDIDIDAVQDYIMFDAKDSVSPWPAAVIGELIESLSEWARREEMIAKMLARRGA